MKKYLILLSAAIVGLTSCLLNVDDVFDESASQRIETAMNEYDELLRSNENGWLVEYWPEAGMVYGGYNLYFKFGEGGTVTVGSELLGDSLQTSLYSIKGDMGPTLNFDTYNSVFHYFSDPSLNVGGGTGYSYEGDYEFVMMGGDESEILIKGKKTRNIDRMTPLPEGMTWSEYVEKIEYIKANGRAPEYKMVIVGEEYEMKSSSRTFTIFDGDREVVVPYIYTPDGLRFYEPVTIAGREYQDFTLDAAAQVYHSSNGTASIYMSFPPMGEVFVKANTYWYIMSYSPTLKTKWNSVSGSMYSYAGLYILYTYLGSYRLDSDKSMWGNGIFFLIIGAGYWYAGYTYEFVPVPDTDTMQDILEINYTDEPFSWGDDGTLKWFLPSLAKLISNNSPYKLTPDDEMNVTQLYFESVNDPDIYFTLLRKEY